jgi:hypothetical protein
LAKVVVTIVVMIAVTFWLATQRAHTAHCKDCSTDVSAIGR